MAQSLSDRLRSSLGSSYVIEKELGGGGMSRVFVAEESALGRRVVVKVLPPELTGAVSAERFQREIHVSARLQHPHIVPVLTAGEMDGIPYYTMPLVEGESLRTRVMHGPLPIPEAVTCLRDVAKALAYAHDHGVVHRDIKPENILLSGDSAAVADFGIAKAIAAARTGERDAATDAQPQTLTQAGVSIGTPAYMAPEQSANDPAIDHRADLYALGCVAYELLTGRTPFVAESSQALRTAQVADVPTDVRTLRPDTPEPLARLVMQCLSKAPSARPQRASEVVRTLDIIVGAEVGRDALIGGGRRALRNAAMVYAVMSAVMVAGAWLATSIIGLPSWVLPSAVVTMTLGLPVILTVAYLQRGSARTLATITGGTLAAFFLVVAAWMGLRAIGIGPFGSLLAAGKMRDRDVILVTDFRVSNADSSLGRVMSDAVRTGLSQSSVVSLASQSGIADALVRMQRPALARLDLPLAREMAVREGIKAIVDGDVTGVDGGYILTVRLVTADSGVVLTGHTATGQGPRGLLDAADEVTRALRARLGESLRRVNTSPSLARATTSSLEALRKFSEASRANANRDLERAIALCREAVAIDSTFASAWRLMGNALSNARYPYASIDSAYASAFAFRERVPPVERLSIESFYYRSAAGAPPRDRAKAVDVLWRRIAAGDSESATNALGVVYESRRDWRTADSMYEAASRWRTPVAAFPITNRVTTLMMLGRVAQAESVRAEALRRYPYAAARTAQLYAMPYYRGDVDAMRRSADSLTSSDNLQLRAWAWRTRSDLAIRAGRVADWYRDRARARQVDEQRGVRAPTLPDSIVASDMDVVLFGESRRAAARLDATVATLPRSGGRLAIADHLYLQLAGAFARAGRPDRARDILARYETEVSDTSMRRRLLPLRHTALAELALAELRYPEAVAEFRRGDSLPDGPATSCAACLPLDLARTFDRAAQPDSAIVMYERFLATPTPTRYVSELDGVWLAATHQRLAALYEARGESERAKRHYRAFIDLWKDADLALKSRVLDAWQRLAKL